MNKNIKVTALLMLSMILISATITACGAPDNSAATNTNTSTAASTEAVSQDSTEPSSESTSDSEAASAQESTSAQAEAPNSSHMSFDPNTQVQIIADVKEVRETSLLVTSKTEPYIGDFEVTFDELEVSGIEARKRDNDCLERYCIGNRTGTTRSGCDWFEPIKSVMFSAQSSVNGDE